jgi:hypothetical protein
MLDSFQRILLVSRQDEQFQLNRLLQKIIKTVKLKKTTTDPTSFFK